MKFVFAAVSLAVCYASTFDTVLKEPLSTEEQQALQTESFKFRELNRPTIRQIPLTNFDCSDFPEEFSVDENDNLNEIPAMYPDLETGCEVFHMCYRGEDTRFLCPEKTRFNPISKVCDWFYNVECPTVLGLASTETVVEEHQAVAELEPVVKEVVVPEATIEYQESLPTTIIENPTLAQEHQTTIIEQQPLTTTTILEQPIQRRVYVRRPQRIIVRPTYQTFVENIKPKIFVQRPTTTFETTEPFVEERIELLESKPNMVYIQPAVHLGGDAIISVRSDQYGKHIGARNYFITSNDQVFNFGHDYQVVRVRPEVGLQVRSLINTHRISPITRVIRRGRRYLLSPHTYSYARSGVFKRVLAERTSSPFVLTSRLGFLANELDTYVTRNVVNTVAVPQYRYLVNALRSPIKTIVSPF